MFRFHDALKTQRASLLALALIIFATGGASATAASLITSKQIKDDTIRSVDVRNGSLILKDFKASERMKLSGPRGAVGPTGATGPTGPAGAGPEGPTGPAGPTVFAVPAPGTLISGYVLLEAYAETAGNQVRALAPLPFRASPPLTIAPERNMFAGAAYPVFAPGEADSSRCSGTGLNPTVSPGSLCVYGYEIGNVAAGSASLMSIAVPESGFLLRAKAASPGNVVLAMKWVYRAP